MAPKVQKQKLTLRLSCPKGCEDAAPGRLKKLVGQICKTFYAGLTEVNISIVDDDIIRRVHKSFLGSAKKTDVISFDLSSKEDRKKTFEIIVNIDQARRQAVKRGHSVAAETALYVTHGLLHQCGFDDLTKTQAARMHRQEDAILEQAGYGPVYDSGKKG